MEGCIPNLLGRGEGQQIKKVNDDKDLHCSAHQIKGTVVGGIIEMPSRRQAVMKSSGCRCWFCFRTWQRREVGNIWAVGGKGELLPTHLSPGIRYCCREAGTAAKFEGYSRWLQSFRRSEKGKHGGRGQGVKARPL